VKRPLCAASCISGTIAAASRHCHREIPNSAGGHDVIVLHMGDDEAGRRWRAAHSRGVPAGVTGGLVLHGAQPAADACPKPRCEQRRRRSGATQRAAGCVRDAPRHTADEKAAKRKTPRWKTSRTGLRFQQIGRQPLRTGGVATSVRRQVGTGQQTRGGISHECNCASRRKNWSGQVTAAVVS
jgi:hypothetical protein